MHTPVGSSTPLRRGTPRATRKTILVTFGAGVLGLVLGPRLARAGAQTGLLAPQTTAAGLDYLIARVGPGGSLDYLPDVTLPGFGQNVADAGSIDLTWPAGVVAKADVGAPAPDRLPLEEGATLVLIGTFDGTNFTAERVSLEPPARPDPPRPSSKALLLP